MPSWIKLRCRLIKKNQNAINGNRILARNIDLKKKIKLKAF